jgi:hypothetical protein
MQTLQPTQHPLDGLRSQFGRPRTVFDRHQLQPIDYMVLYGWLLKQPLPLTRFEVQRHWQPTWTLDEVDRILQELVRLTAVERHGARAGIQHDTFSAGALPPDSAHVLPKRLAVPNGSASHAR